ncbi:hypothetical protein Droror1_Dr00013584 [Drosera rotundifolia]
MSSLHATNTSFNPRVDEQRWIIQIRHILDDQRNDDDDDNIDIPICIFNVPKALISTNPEMYTPQVVALGPYHSWRPELCDMESYKLSAAKRTQKKLQKIIKFHSLVEQIKILEPRIRCSYHKYLDINSETLAWMMAIDSSFLLEFLQIYDDANETGLSALEELRMQRSVSYMRKRLTRNAILRDIVMLENQIPLFLLRKMLEFQFQSLQLADEKLLSLLMGFCGDVFPFDMATGLPMVEVSSCAHLLDFLHQTVVPKIQRNSEVIEELEDHELEHVQEEAHDRMLSRLMGAASCCMKRLVVSRPVRSIFKLPWVIISNSPVLTILKQPVEHFFFTREFNHQRHENDNPSLRTVDGAPLMEEISIPSVVELSRSGIQFFPSDGDIRSINFDPTTNKFYLPTIKLDLNSEVILRNLVAYEASDANGPLIFTRYTELMNGIIDTAEDAKLLRKRGIILNHLKSDEEVVNLWNGMNKSLRLTRVQFLDQAIEDVNKYYHGKWKIKVEKFIKAYVFSSWRSITLLAAVFLFLMTLQVCSSVFNSARTSRVRGRG